MLLNNVLAGYEYTTVFSEPHLTGPPSGYDSVCTPLSEGTERSEDLTRPCKQVYGQPGRDLNYDELVVYDEHAIRPAYLVMYG